MDSKDPLKPIRIESKEVRKIPASPLSNDSIKKPDFQRQSKLSTQEIMTPMPLSPRTIPPGQPDHRRASNENLPKTTQSSTPQPTQQTPNPARITPDLDADESHHGNTGISKKKRIELAQLLWGEGEEEFDTEDSPTSGTPSLSKRLTDQHAVLPDTPRVQSLREELKLHRERKQVEAQKRTSGDQVQKPDLADNPLPPGYVPAPKGVVRQFNRRECSFPGMLTVLIPEETFQPQKYAVRVIDISPSGARMETRQMDEKLAQTLNKERWYARLEMLVPHREKMKVRGRLVWASFQDPNSLMGLQFEENCPQVDALFTDPENQNLIAQEILLRSPIMDPFPSVTPSESFTFKGRVQEDTELVVVATTTGAQYQCVPEEGRFSIRVPLVPNKSNFLSFIAKRGTNQSIPTPAAILHKTGVTETISYSVDNLVEDFYISPNGKTLNLTLTGSPARFFKALKVIEQSLAFATDLTLNLELHGEAQKAAKKLAPILPKDKQTE